MSRPMTDPERAYRASLTGARQRGLEHSLSLEDFQQLYDECSGCCQTTGIPFSDEKDGKWRPWRVSVDRLDNTKGYVPGNVRLTIQLWNIAQNDYTDAAMDRLCTARAERLGWRPPSDTKTSGDGGLDIATRR